MYVCKIIIILAVGASCCILATCQRLQIIRFFQNAECSSTSSQPFRDIDRTTNLSALPLPSPTYRSYCVIRGAWRVEFAMVQSNRDYNISSGDGCTTCISMGSSYNLRYGLVKRIGGEDVTQAFLSLYSEPDFTGKESIVNGWEYTFNDTFSFSSLAFNSFNNWTWQTYTLPRFRGSSQCFRPNLRSEVTLIDRSTLSVGSVRLGCRNSGNLLRHGKTGTTVFAILAVILLIPSVIL